MNCILDMKISNNIFCFSESSAPGTEKKPTDLALTSSALLPKSMSYFSGSKNKNRNKKHIYDLDADTPQDLEPLLELIVALASDIPQTFYEHHFNTLLPHIVAHTHTKRPQQIEQVFLCIVSLIVVLKNYLQNDSYRIYSDCFAELLSNRRPWYINDMAAQCLAILVRKVQDKEVFFYKAFKRLKRDSSQIDGLGKLLTAVMKSNSLNRIHNVSPEIMRTVLNVLTLKSVPTEKALNAIITGMKGLAFFITKKNSQKPWQDFWNEDGSLVWEPIWRQMDRIAYSLDNSADDDAGEALDSDDERDIGALRSERQEAEDSSDDETSQSKSSSCLVDSHTRLLSTLKVLEFMISFKHGALLLDVNLACKHLEFVISNHSSEVLGYCVSDILLELLRSSNFSVNAAGYNHNHAIQILRHKLLSLMFKSKFPSTVIFSFARRTIQLKHFSKECLPKMIHFMEDQILNSSELSLQMDVLTLLMEVIVHHQPPVKCGEEIQRWETYAIEFNEECTETKAPTTVPAIIKHLISRGLSDDLSNCKELITSILCFPHVNSLDHQEINSYLAWILHSTLEKLEVSPKSVLEKQSLTPKNLKKKNKKDTSENIQCPTLDLNINVSLDEDAEKVLFLIDVLIETMSHTLPAQEFLASLSNLAFINILKKHPQHRENAHLLRAIDIYLTIASNFSSNDEVESPISQDLFCDLYKILAPTLASSSSPIRLLTTHILSLFPLQLPPPPAGVEQQEGLFSIMHKVESCEMTALNYNERLRLMALLDAEHINSHSPISGICVQAPLLFAMGQFYVNLSPVWGYAVTFLAEFGKKLNEDQFWPLWLAKLKLTSHSAHNQLTNLEEDKIGAVFGAESSVTKIHDYLMEHDAHFRLSKRVDHANARNLMWKTMHKFPKLCESKGRDIVDFFFQFMETEMHTTDFSVAPTQNLLLHFRNDFEDEDETEHTKSSENTSLDKSQEIDGQEEEQGDTKESSTNEVYKRAGKLIINSLCNYLTLFSRFSNLKCVPQADKLEILFSDLLVHPSVRVQEHALDCIMSFKHQHVVPYEKNLRRIHNDKTFKSGVINFCVDEAGSEGSNIAASHREKLMPLYIRILYGKMQTSTGKNTSGSNKTNARKSTVMRLLAGIKDEESEHLLKLAFEILLPHLNGSSLDIVNRTFEGMDVSQCIPLKRMLGILGTLDNVLHYLGNLIPSQQPFFLKVIMLLLSQTCVLRDGTEGVHSSHKPMLRKLHQRSLKQLLKFVEIFPDYKWSADEIEAVFIAVIWPSLYQLNESIGDIHPLLRLFSLWSEMDKFHSLFIKHHPDDKELYPLKQMLLLVSLPNCKLRVTNFVIDIINNLVGSADTTEDHESEEKPVGGKKRKYAKTKNISKMIEDDELCHEAVEELFECDNLLPVVDPTPRVAGGEPPSFGLKIILPHVLLISKCLQVIVHQASRKTCINNEHLRILCRITEFVHDSKQGDQLLALIIPLLTKRKVTSSEVVSHLLTTCGHLLPISNDYQNISFKMLSLFRCVSNQSPRNDLCQVYCELAKSYPEFRYLSELMLDFNSWEVNHAESMDITLRVKTYNNVTSKVQELENLDAHLVMYITQQCFYDLNYVSDITIQGCSIRCLTDVMKYLNTFKDQDAVKSKVIVLYIISQLKVGIQAESDTIHSIHFQLLGAAVREIGAHQKTLKDLVNIIEYDEKMPKVKKIDFFENMAHLQMSRRGQTLSKLVTAIKEETLVIRSDTIEMYIWPLISRYLTHQRYAEESGLLSASVTCIGIIASKLPWALYLSTLKYFLKLLTGVGKMKNVRLGLKAVCTILDAFHEDVSGLVLASDVDKKKDEKIILSNRKRKLNSIANKEVQKVSSTTESESWQVDEEEESANDLLPDNAPISKQDAHGRMVYRALVQDIIPSLKKVFDTRSKAASNHKLNKTRQADNDEIKKIPVALPLVKLLKKFPPEVLDANLSNVFYHLITFLKSHVPYIRRDAREMLVSVLREAGGKYLPGLIKDLKVNLNLGFLKHVLVFTVKHILVNSVDFIQPQDVGKCTSDIVSICTSELFTNKNVEDKNAENEEKSQTVMEAEGEKSFAIMSVLGQFVQVRNMGDVYVPLKAVLESTHKNSVVKLVEKCLTHFTAGMDKNQVIGIKEKSIFIYGILTEKIQKTKEAKAAAEAPEKSVWDVPDRRLLEPEPKRCRLSAKTSATTNSHVVVEFAFDLLNKLLRTSTFNPLNKEHCGLLDPFVNLLGDFIQSDDPEVAVSCLKCFTQMVKFPLPMLKKKIDSLTAQMFVLLNKYSTTELEKGPIFTLIQLTFRSLSVIMKSVPYYNMKSDHANVLLLYAKENLTNQIHQQSVFTLLHSLIQKRVDPIEMGKLMETIKVMIIKSESVLILDQARSVFFEYFTKYPITSVKALELCRYYRDNLNYPEAISRVSVCIMLDNLITNIPDEFLSQKVMRSVWIRLIECLIQEEDLQCRNQQQMSLLRIFEHTSDKQFLVKETLLLMKDESNRSRGANATFVRLGCLSILSFTSNLSSYIDSNEELTSKYPTSFFTDILPCVVTLLSPSRFTPVDDTDQSAHEEQLCIDKSLLELLRAFEKLYLIYRHDKKWKNIVSESVWDYIVDHLLYGEFEVRMSCGSLIGKLFSEYMNNSKKCPSIAKSPDKVRGLVYDFCEIFKCTAPVSDDKFKQLCLIAVRNLIFLVKQSSNTPMVTEDFTKDTEYMSKAEKSRLKALLPRVAEHGQIAVSATWVLQNVCKIAHEEINRKETLRREAALNLIAGIVLVLGEKLVESGPALDYIMSHIAMEEKHAEFSEQQSFTVLLNEVTDVLKDRLGWEMYSEILVKAQKSQNIKRSAKRVSKHELNLRDQTKAIANKTKRLEAATQSRKRKMSNGKPFVNKKRRNV